MELFRSVLMGAGAAFILAATGVLVGLLLGWRRRNGAYLTGLASLGVALGFVAGDAAILGLPAVPPAEALHRLVYVTILAALLCLLDAAEVLRGWTLRLTHFAFFTAAAGWILLPVLGVRWSAIESAGWLLVFGLGMSVLEASVEPVAERRDVDVQPFVLLGMCLASSGVAILSGAAVLSQLLMLLLVALLPAVLFGLVRRGAMARESRAPGVATIGTVVLCGLWLIGFFFGDVPASAILLLSLAPAVSRLLASLLEKRHRFTQFGVRLAVAAVPAALAVLLAYHPEEFKAPTEADEDWSAAAVQNFKPSAASAESSIPIVPAGEDTPPIPPP